ncbi:MAG TPA: hypothetical protein VK737_08675 [Opitutales bacterium]|jgi:hypothetical protein|nr:hypothetical protein [Opitutales bacterium]
MKSYSPVSIILVILGCVFFGGLMSLRDSMDSIWLRALLAGGAGSILAAFFCGAFSIYKKRSGKI